jgi:hypothetical protein
MKVPDGLYVARMVREFLDCDKSCFPVGKVLTFGSGSAPDERGLDTLEGGNMPQC